MLFLPKSKIFDALICDISTFKVLDHADFLTWQGKFPVLTRDLLLLIGDLVKKATTMSGISTKTVQTSSRVVKKEEAGAARDFYNKKISKKGEDHDGSFPDPPTWVASFICKSIIYRRFLHREILVQAQRFRLSLKTLYLVHCAKTTGSFSRTARRSIY